MTQLRVVLAGQEAAGHHALRRILDAGHRVVAVFTDPDKDALGTSNLAATATSEGIEQREAGLVRRPELGLWLRDQAVDVFLNVHSLHVVAAAVVEAPLIGSFNLHPGPLPGYPGLNAPSWAIYERQETFGCTVHWMNEEIDAGLIAYDTTFPIGQRESGLTLAARCAREGLSLLSQLLDVAATAPGDIPRRPQRGTRVERGPGPPHGGWVRWTEPAESIAAFVRACDYGPFSSPWKRPRVLLDGSELHVVRAEAVSDSSGRLYPPGTILAADDAGLVVVAGGGSTLRLSRLERDGESVLPARVAKPGASFSVDAPFDARMV